MPANPAHLGCALVASTLFCLPVSSAQATLVSSGGTCATPALSEPFAQWGDTSSYALVPQGDFEGSLSQWTLSGGAAQTGGSESFGATGAVGSYSLKLPAGATAQSPFMCVDSSYPTFRFFVRDGGSLATLAVSVVYKTALGPLALPLDVLAPGGAWLPTQPIPTAAAVTGLLSGGTTQLALRFSGLTGATDVDDVFIDPRMR